MFNFLRKNKHVTPASSPPPLPSVSGPPGTKHLRDHSWQVTEPTPIQIGKPASPPTADALAALRQAISATGATKVYWFWVSIGGDRPHLGLAVAPPDDHVVSSVVRAVEPLWKHHSPNNPLFDILRLGDPKLDSTILAEGQLLYTRA